MGEASRAHASSRRRPSDIGKRPHSRPDGLVAPFILDGPMTGEAFLVYLDEILIPTLEINDIVVMDSLPAHKVAGFENGSKPPV